MGERKEAISRHCLMCFEHVTNCNRVVRGRVQLMSSVNVGFKKFDHPPSSSEGGFKKCDQPPSACYEEHQGMHKTCCKYQLRISSCQTRLLQYPDESIANGSFEHSVCKWWGCQARRPPWIWPSQACCEDPPVWMNPFQTGHSSPIL